MSELKYGLFEEVHNHINTFLHVFLYISPSALLKLPVMFFSKYLREICRWNWNDKYCLQKMVVSRRTSGNGPSNTNTVKLQQTLCGIC